ncbi:MAG: Mrp/NBP35 family ATP-binding protein [Candidatus Helarchaeota archaeon]
MSNSNQSPVPDHQEQDKKIKEKMAKVRYKIVIMSGKGGVGKTTVAINLAIALALRAGNRVGIMDADITGPNVPKMLGVTTAAMPPPDPQTGIIPAIGPMNMKIMSMAFLLGNQDTPIVWRGPLKMGALRQFITDVNWGDLDYLIVDLPPGTSDEPLSILQMIPDARVIIVTTPQDVALLDVRKSITMVGKMGVPVLGVIENMSGSIKCPKCGEIIELFGEGGGKKAAEDLGVAFLGSVPVDADIRKDSDAGRPFVVRHSEKDAAKAFDAIVTKIREILEKP